MKRPTGPEIQVIMQFQDFLGLKNSQNGPTKVHADLVEGSKASGDVCEVPLNRFIVQHRWYGCQIIKKICQTVHGSKPIWDPFFELWRPRSSTEKSFPAPYVILGPEHSLPHAQGSSSPCQPFFAMQNRILQFPCFGVFLHQNELFSANSVK